jgi:hypothetical protein
MYHPTVPYTNFCVDNLTLLPLPIALSTALNTFPFLGVDLNQDAQDFNDLNN